VPRCTYDEPVEVQRESVTATQCLPAFLLPASLSTVQPMKSMSTPYLSPQCVKTSNILSHHVRGHRAMADFGSANGASNHATSERYDREAGANNITRAQTGLQGASYSREGEVGVGRALIRGGALHGLDLGSVHHGLGPGQAIGGIEARTGYG